MIDTARESLVSFADAPEFIPGRPHLAQVYRWAMRGLRGIKLEWVKVGGKRFTSKEALARFYSALTLADGGEAAPTHQHQHEQAERALEAAGI